MSDQDTPTIVEGEIEEAPTVIDDTIKGEPEKGLVVIGEAALDPNRKPLALADLTDDDVRALEAAVMQNDYGQLTTRQRMAAMFQKCQALGLDIRLNPFVWAVMNKKLVPVRTKHASSQSRGNMKITLLPVQQVLDHRAGIYMVMMKATQPSTGRTDYDIGAASILNLHGEAYANAIMVAWTKAKNRVTESMETTGVALSEEEVASVARVDAENAQAARMIDPQAREKRKRVEGLDGGALEGAEGSYLEDLNLAGGWKREPKPTADPIPPLEEIGEPGESPAYTTEGGPQGPVVRAPRAAPARAQSPGEPSAAPGPSAVGAARTGPKAPPAAARQAGSTTAPAGPVPAPVAPAPPVSAETAAVIQNIKDAAPPPGPVHASGPPSVGGAPRPPVPRIGGGTASASAPSAPSVAKPPQPAPVKAGPRAAPARKK